MALISPHIVNSNLVPGQFAGKCPDRVLLAGSSAFGSVSAAVIVDAPNESFVNLSPSPPSISSLGICPWARMWEGMFQQREFLRNENKGGGMGGSDHSCARFHLLEHREESVSVCVCPYPPAVSPFSDGISVCFRMERKYRIDGRGGDCVGTPVLSLQAFSSLPGVAAIDIQMIIE